MKSNINVLDNKKILKSINAISKIDIFFIFYQSRCPKGDLHDWDNKKCKKCDLETKFFTVRDSNSKNYYDLYYNIFNDTVKTLSVTNSAEKVLDNLNDKSKLDNSIYKNIDYSYVDKLSKKMNIDISLINSIGCTNFRNYDNIKNGSDADNQPPFESYYDERIYAASAEIRYIFTMYSLLKTITKNQNSELIHLLEHINLPKHEYKNIKYYLPNINAIDYNKYYNFIIKHKKIEPKKLFNFVINNIAYHIMIIANYDSAKNKSANKFAENNSANKFAENNSTNESAENDSANDSTNDSTNESANDSAENDDDINLDNKYSKIICTEFSKFLISNILKNQKLLSKPLHFTWKYFTEVDTDNVNDLEQIGDIGEDDPIEEENIYSSKNIDYDMNSDSEADNYKEIE